MEGREEERKGKGEEGEKEGGIEEGDIFAPFSLIFPASIRAQGAAWNGVVI